MRKSKLKLLLIEDYVELNKISLACDKFLNCQLKKEGTKILNEMMVLKDELFNVYEKVIFRLGLMDVSFLLIKEGFERKKDLMKHDLPKLNLQESYMKLKLLYKTIIFKLKKLSFNEIELSYITQNLTFYGKD